LRNDLENAALFDVSSGGGAAGDLNNINFQSIFDAGADYLIAGQYQTVGNKIKIAVQLYNVKEERPILGQDRPHRLHFRFLSTQLASGSIVFKSMM